MDVRKSAVKHLMKTKDLQVVADQIQVCGEWEESVRTKIIKQLPQIIVRRDFYEQNI